MTSSSDNTEFDHLSQTCEIRTEKGEPGPVFGPRPIGRYELHEMIGSGGMGEVFVGVDPQLRRSIAIKRVRNDYAKDERRRARLAHEARLNARLSHPSIVQVYDYCRHEGDDFIISEYIEGNALAHVLEQGSLSPVRALEIARSIAAGLSHAHEQGVIHRDLKTENILVGVDGCIKIADFGIAQSILDSDEPRNFSSGQSVSGTYRAMSPEQSRGEETDHRSDLFSLGTLMYELFSGRSPFAAASRAHILDNVRHKDVVPLKESNASLPERLSDLVHRLLEKNPADRPQTAAEVCEVLAEVQLSSGLPVQDTQAVHELIPEVAVLTCRLSCEVPFDGATAAAEQFELTAALERELTRLANEHTGTSAYVLGLQGALCFGYPKGHSNNCERAMRAALELQDRLTASLAQCSSATLRASVQVRVGVDVGSVAVRKLSTRSLFSGLAVNASLALAEAAEPGQVWVSARVYRLLSRYFKFQATKILHAPQLAAQLQAFRVDGVLVPEIFSTNSTAAPFVGREEDLIAFRRAVDPSRTPKGRAILVLGEAGVGKSRLLNSGLSELDLEQIHALHVAGSSDSKYSPFAPFRRIVAQLLGLSAHGEHLENRPHIEQILEGDTRLQDIDTELLMMILGLAGPDECDAFRSFESEQQASRTRDAIIQVLQRAAQELPIVVVIEDLHWIDHSSLQVLHTLVDALEGHAITLILTARPDFAGRLSEHAKVEKLVLDRLTSAETFELIDSLTQVDPLPPELRHWVYKSSEGVPLAVEELCHYAQSQIKRPESQQNFSPDACSMTGLAAHRLSELASIRDIIELSSLIGREVSIDLLSHAAQCADAEIIARLRPAFTNGLLHLSGYGKDRKVTFRHALLREAIKNTVTTARVQEMCGRIATSLDESFKEDLDASPELYVEHFILANKPGRALELARRAIGCCLNRGAHVEVAVHVKSTLDLVPKVVSGRDAHAIERTVRGEASRSLIALHGWSGHAVVENNERLRALSIELGDSRTLGELWSAFVQSSVGGDIAAVEDIILELGQRPSDNCTDVLGNTARGYLAFHDGHWTVAEQYFQRAHRALSSDADLVKQISALSMDVETVPAGQLAWLDVMRGKPKEAYDLIQTMADKYANSENIVARTNIGAYCVSLGICQGHGEYAELFLEQAIRTLKEVVDIEAFAFYRQMYLVAKGRLAMLRETSPDRLREHAQMVQAGCAVILSVAKSAGAALFNWACTECLLEAGMIEEAESLLTSGHQLAAGRMGTYAIADMHRLEAILHTKKSDPAAAKRSFEACEQALHELGQRDHVGAQLCSQKLDALRA